MTPAITLLKRSKTPHSVHRYAHDDTRDDYGQEAAEQMGVAAERVFKTLVCALDDGRLAVGVVPVAARLSMKALAAALDTRSATLAAADDVRRATGYVLGGVSPLGQKRTLPTLLDASMQRFDTVFVSAGRRGLEVELAPADLARLTGASFVDLQAQ